MKVKISSEEYNPLLKRKEVAFEVEHKKTGGTPSRFEIKKSIAALLKIDPERVYVKKMETKTGTVIAVGEANAYDSIEQAKLVEPEHIIARNAPPEKQEEQKEPEKQEKPEKPEKPKEQEKEGKTEEQGEPEELEEEKEE